MLRNAVQEDPGNAPPSSSDNALGTRMTDPASTTGLLGVAAPASSAMAPTDRPTAHGGADFGDLAAALETEDRGGTGRWRSEALALQQIRAVHGRRPYRDADVVRPERRCRHLADVEDVSSPGWSNTTARMHSPSAVPR